MTSGNSDANSANGNAPQNPALVVSALLVTGFGIGWLAGLSVSPVISVVITSVTGSVAAIVAALSGVKEEFFNLENSSATLRRLLKAITPVPLAWLVIGLILGASVGVWARTHNWLGSSPFADVQAELQFWQEAGLDKPTIAQRLFEHRYGVRGWPNKTLDAELDRWAAATGLERNVIAQRLFESTYSAAQTSNAGVKAVSAGNENAPLQSGVLFAVSLSDCTDIKNEKGKALSDEMQTAANPQLAKIAEIITDTLVLERMVKEVLCVGG